MAIEYKDDIDQFLTRKNDFTLKSFFFFMRIMRLTWQKHHMFYYFFFIIEPLWNLINETHFWVVNVQSSFCGAAIM